MKKIIFTVVAKNYFASAITLGKSVSKYVSNCDFKVILCDELSEKLQLQEYEFEVIEACKLGIPDFEKISFLYDIVEMSTAIKPFTILYLMETLGYDKVLYLDPDTWVMDSLDDIFESLDNTDFVLTPHIVDLGIVSSTNKEEHILNRGVFNLGFLGIRKSETAYPFLHWWKDRLNTSCYRDSTVFVDQKWVDFLPVFCSNYNVVRSKAYNIADWNYQERELGYRNEEYYVLEANGQWENIKFFHFSGIKVQKPEEILNNFGIHNKKQREVIGRLIKIYQAELLANGYKKFSIMNYKYNFYDNGERIELLHRRIYRGLLEGGIDIKCPFNTDKNGELYRLVKGKNKKEMDNRQVSFKETVIRRAFKFLRKISGDQQYQNYLKALHTYSDIDKQTFLIS